MSLRALFALQALLLLVIGILYVFGLTYYLFWRLWWFDIVLHTMGGLWVVLATGWLMLRYSVPPRILPLLGVLICISVAWEFFELLTGFRREDNYAFDTGLDLVMDLIGGAVGYLLISFQKPKESNATIAQ